MPYSIPGKASVRPPTGGGTEYDLDAVVENKRLLERGPTTFDAGKADGRFLLKLPAALLAMRRVSRRTKQARKTARDLFENRELPRFLEYVKLARPRDLTALSDPDVINELNARRREVLDRFAPEPLKPGFAGALAFEALRSVLVQLMGPGEGNRVASALTSALEGDKAFEQSAMLYKVARGEVSMERFLDHFGHRTSGEMELAVPRWREDPSEVRRTVRRMKSFLDRSPRRIHEENLRRRRACEEELPSILAKCGGSSLRERILRDLRQAQELLPFRESGKHFLMMGYELIRMAIEELARRWELDGDIYFLRLDELERFPGERERLRNCISERRVRWQAWKRLYMEDVIDSGKLAGLGLPHPGESSGRLFSTQLAGGVANGTAFIVFDPGEASELPEDCVLVCPSTDPGWTPLFPEARALVLERGGVLSHGAIVARDFGIPAVVCPGATQLLNTGDRIRVDGNKGLIEVLDRKPDHDSGAY